MAFSTPAVPLLAATCRRRSTFLEYDHVHNLPMTIRSKGDHHHDWYWNVDRVAYMEHCPNRRNLLAFGAL